MPTYVNVLSIVKEKGSDGGLYVGTDAGVFYTNNKYLNSGGSVWQNFSIGLPNAGVYDIQINYALNKIRAATFGRGLWESPLACPPDIDLTENNLIYTTNDFKEAEHDITSNSTVGSNINITYRAGNQIHLQPGFSASGANTYFHGFIHACNHPGNSFQRYSHSGNNNNSENSTQESFASNNKEKKKNYAELRIQPNPNNGTFTLNVLNSFNPENTVEISDLAGRKVFSKNFIKQQEILNLDLENGTYLIKYYDGINAHSQMIIINK